MIDCQAVQAFCNSSNIDRAAGAIYIDRAAGSIYQLQVLAQSMHPPLAVLCLQVAWLNAEVIAAEMLALVQVASPHIKAQWAWASACNLIKMTSVRPEAFPVSSVPHNPVWLSRVLARLMHGKGALYGSTRGWRDTVVAGSRAPCIAYSTVLQEGTQ